MKSSATTSCAEYRQEMLLLGMKRQLENPALSATERMRIAEEIGQLERQLGMA